MTCAKCSAPSRARRANKLQQKGPGFRPGPFLVGSYASSVRNLASISYATDNVFSDGYTTQLVTLTGDVSNGYVATITVGMSV